MVSDAPHIPARDDATEFQSLRRGESLLDVLSGIGIDVAGKQVVDLGAGFGSISIACAASGARPVTSVDVNTDRLRLIEERAERAGVELQTLQANLLEPWRGPTNADYAFMIGVVEYAGLWDEAADIHELQVQVLRKAYEALAPGGTLIFASKNRWWPRHLAKDFHTHLPLVNALPRRAADRLSQAKRNEPYRHYIHSPKKWSALIRKAGFSQAQSYAPLFSYQLPLVLSTRPTLHELREVRMKELSADERKVAFGRTPWPVAGSMIALAGALGVQCAPHVVVVATK